MTKLTNTVDLKVIDRFLIVRGLVPLPRHSKEGFTMIEIISIASIVTFMFLLRDKNKYETVYNGDESSLGEANEYYWLLRNNKIPVKYQIPYNWENFYQFGYKESPIYLKVSKKDIEKARQAMMYYRVEKAKMERNMEANRNKL